MCCLESYGWASIVFSNASTHQPMRSTHEAIRHAVSRARAHSPLARNTETWRWCSTPSPPGRLPWRAVKFVIYNNIEPITPISSHIFVIWCTCNLQIQESLMAESSPLPPARSGSWRAPSSAGMSPPVAPGWIASPRAKVEHTPSARKMKRHMVHVSIAKLISGTNLSKKMFMWSSICLTQNLHCITMLKCSSHFSYTLSLHLLITCMRHVLIYCHQNSNHDFTVSEQEIQIQI